MDAEDNRGGQAAEFNIAIRYCYCLNGGVCPDFSSLQQGYGEGEGFALVECQCSTGWSGKQCIIQGVMYGGWLILNLCTSCKLQRACSVHDATMRYDMTI